jgi:hypothetical protein
MRIIDAEPQLVRDILDELEIVESHEKDKYTVHVGRHQLLGRMVVLSFTEEDGGGVVVEME